MNRPTVLILASDPAFARSITENWPPERVANSQEPEFTVLDANCLRDLRGSHYDLAIADASSLDKSKDDKRKRPHERPNHERLNIDLKQSLIAAGKPAILIHSDPSRDLYRDHGALLELRREPGTWAALAGLIGREILRRSQAESRAREAEKICTAAQAEATLGRYMVEMRTNVNNALTTVLGNAELLAHEPGLPSTVHAQADAIRNMALRLHEVIQRFSSLEKELSVAARESNAKTASASAGGR